MTDKSNIINWITEIMDDLKIYAFSHCGAELAEDMYHSTIEYILKNELKLNEQINDQKHLLSYCKLKVKHLTIGHFRKFKKIDQFKESEDKPYGFELDEIAFLEGGHTRIDKELTEDANRAWGKISSECRELLMLSLYGDTSADLSEKLGIPIATVNTRKHRCFNKLKDLIIS